MVIIKTIRHLNKSVECKLASLDHYTTTPTPTNHAWPSHNYHDRPFLPLINPDGVRLHYATAEF